jgi:hypothetical protein
MMQRRVEIVGADCRPDRGLRWRSAGARVHERARAAAHDGRRHLRLREWPGVLGRSVYDARRRRPMAHTRKRATTAIVIAVHAGRKPRIVHWRQNVINALPPPPPPAPRSSPGRSRRGNAEGELALADGRRLCRPHCRADGSNCACATLVCWLSASIRHGCTRLLMDKTPEERAAAPTMERPAKPSPLNITGTRRASSTPCSETEVYVALTMLDEDEAAKAVPVRKGTWKRAFPHLETLIDRIGEQGRYDRFELIKLRRWSAGRVAIIGDAAHALPPNIGQGGGCAMMNALSLAVHLDREPDVSAALAAWERQERPITDHTQRISILLGLPTTWPPPLRAFALALAVRSKWLTDQRTRTALHRPTGT